MPLDTTLTLIQFVALALPAIAIYMDVVVTSREAGMAEQTPRRPEFESPYGYSYHAMRASILLLVFAVGLLFANLLILVLPEWIQLTMILILAALCLYGAIIMLGISILVFGLAVAFQHAPIRDDLTIHRSLGILVDHLSDGIKNNDWAKSDE